MILEITLPGGQEARTEASHQPGQEGPGAGACPPRQWARGGCRQALPAAEKVHAAGGVRQVHPGVGHREGPRDHPAPV